MSHDLDSKFPLAKYQDDVILHSKKGVLDDPDISCESAQLVIGL